MGAGINLFRQLFPEDYYAYQTATLISSKPTSKVIKDSNDQTIATYPLGGDELRGLLKVVDGQLVAYGDVKGSDGNGTEVFGIVDLGTLTWEYVDIITAFRCNSIGAKGVDTSTVGNIICSMYVSNTYNAVQMATTELMIALRTNGGLLINNPNYTDAATFKTAMSGKYLIYEKATPTAKSYTPFTNPMLCGSTEEFTDSRTLKMPCGHDSLYYSSPFKGW